MVYLIVQFYLEKKKYYETGKEKKKEIKKIFALFFIVLSYWK